MELSRGGSIGGVGFPSSLPSSQEEETRVEALL
jgi:hypothetical protein